MVSMLVWPVFGSIFSVEHLSLHLSVEHLFLWSSYSPVEHVISTNWSKTEPKFLQFKGKLK